MPKRSGRQRKALRLLRLTTITLLVSYSVTLLGLPLKFSSEAPRTAENGATRSSRRCGCPPALIRKGECCCQPKVAFAGRR